jgi:hypothetical protein
MHRVASRKGVIEVHVSRNTVLVTAGSGEGPTPARCGGDCCNNTPWHRVIIMITGDAMAAGAAACKLGTFIGDMQS